MAQSKVTMSRFLTKMVQAQQSGDTYEQKVKRLIQDMIQDLAVTGEEWIKVYPPPPPPATRRTKNGRIGVKKSYWQRGVGWIQYGKDGSRKVTTPSELLYTKWTILRQGNVLTLTNPASYAPVVHWQNTQKSYHFRRGWRNEQQMLGYVTRYMRSKYKRRIMPLIKVV